MDAVRCLPRLLPTPARPSSATLWSSPCRGSRACAATARPACRGRPGGSSTADRGVGWMRWRTGQWRRRRRAGMRAHANGRHPNCCCCRRCRHWRMRRDEIVCPAGVCCSQAASASRWRTASGCWPPLAAAGGERCGSHARRRRRRSDNSHRNESFRTPWSRAARADAPGCRGRALARTSARRRYGRHPPPCRRRLRPSHPSRLRRTTPRDWSTRPRPWAGGEG